MKGEGVDAGLRWTATRGTVRTTGKTLNFNVDNEDTESVASFAYFGSVINSDGLRLGRAAMEKLGKLTKSQDVSLKTKGQILHILTFPFTKYKKCFIGNTALEGSSVDIHPEPPGRYQVGFRGT